VATSFARTSFNCVAVSFVLREIYEPPRSSQLLILIEVFYKPINKLTVSRPRGNRHNVKEINGSETQT
jgi:hypothetical protein